VRPGTDRSGSRAWPWSPSGRRSLLGIEAQQFETHRFEDDGGFPNSPLPVLIYHEVEAAHNADACEEVFASNDWLPDWRDGIFSFHHFHSITHEVLGIVAGTATVKLGGPSGRSFEIGQGDVLILPAGTGHCNQGSSADLLVIGAYPEGRPWDILRGDPAEHDEVLANIRAVPLPRSDPVNGTNGRLTELWGEPD
jgi:uncharacterized protein YjlB